MELSVFIGLALTLLSGTMMTCAIVPMKFARAMEVGEHLAAVYRVRPGGVSLAAHSPDGAACLGSVRIRQAIGPGCRRALRIGLGYRQCAVGHWLHHARCRTGVDHHPGADGFVRVPDPVAGALPASGWRVRPRWRFTSVLWSWWPDLSSAITRAICARRSGRSMRLQAAQTSSPSGKETFAPASSFALRREFCPAC